MKKKHNWAKGYNQRQKDKQRENTKRQSTKLRKKQPVEMRKGSLKGMKQNDQQIHSLAEQLKDAQQEANKYWVGYEAEKRLTAAQRTQIQNLQSYIRNLKQKEGALILTAFFLGVFVGTMILLFN